jgi:hypothetical protein
VTVMMTNNNCTCNGTIEWFASVSFATMACRRKERNFFLLFRVFFFSSSSSSSRVATKVTHYMTASSKTQECIAQMLTSKPMYKESKCMWGYITWCKSCIVIKPCVCVCVRAPKT